MITKQDFPVSSSEIRQEMARQIRLYRRGTRSKEGRIVIWGLIMFGIALGVVPDPDTSMHRVYIGYRGERMVT